MWSQVSETASTLWRGFRDLLLPPACSLCNTRLPPELDTSPRSCFCRPCAGELLDLSRLSCPRCAATIGPFALVDEGCSRCREEKFAFEAARTFGIYEGALREAVLRLKSRRNEGLAELLGELWGWHAQDSLQALGCGAIVPVPLHWRRRLRRGYNQSAALARGLARYLKLPVLSGCLRRWRPTAPQTSIPYGARKDNVRGAFRASVTAGIKGATVLLLDDVMTTGATLNEAARILRDAGATRVIAAALARAGTD